MYASIGSRNKTFTNDEESDAQKADRVSSKQFSLGKINRIKEDSKFCRKQYQSLLKLHESSDQETVTEPGSVLTGASPNPCFPIQDEITPDHHSILRYETDPHTLCGRAADLSIADLPRYTAPRSNLKRHHSGELCLSDPFWEAKHFIESRNLSASQILVVNNIFTYFCKVYNHKKGKRMKHVSLEELNAHSIIAPHLLLTGDPGSGKSYVTETICELASILKLGIVGTTSYNGIAAVNVDGTTVSSMFSISDTSDAGGTKKLDSDTILKMKNKIDGDNMCFFILDEISTIDSRIIGILDLCMQQIFGNNFPFGGCQFFLQGILTYLGQ